VPTAFSDPPKGRDAATDRQIAKMSILVSQVVIRVSAQNKLI
jgi:hypothetical protein